jgi:hypothetical protein
MSYLTVEVEIDHGHVLAKGAEVLPDKTTGLLTISPPGTEKQAGLSPLQVLESLQKHLRLDAGKAAAWVASVREARR